MASALFNAAREVAGLFGITVIGAVLRARESGALSAGTHPAAAFLDGYHTGLLVTVALIAAGAALSFFALRQVQSTATVPVPAGEDDSERELVGSAH